MKTTLKIRVKKNNFLFKILIGKKKGERILTRILTENVLIIEIFEYIIDRT